MTADFSEDSENEVDEQRHARLIENVLNLDAQQHVKKPTRTEPALRVSEFNLVKSITGSKGTVHLQDLTKSLDKRAKHVKISNKVQKTEELGSQTLRKPLEKPQAERIRRTVAYTKATLSLDRWEPVVTANRAAANLSFPLNTDNLKYNPEVNTGWRLKTPLEQEIEKIEPSVESYEVEAEDKFPLTLKEITERRREFAKLRRHQSYKEAKARQQNKIKSKRYRRILRREKIKRQLKEFELLQKTNPEEALKKLDEIEKARAEERVSLRHRSTGKWAKNQQVRAKYDKESRKVLAQQLTISKDLTQKIQPQGSSDSEGDDEPSTSSLKVAGKDDSNPWTKTVAPSAEIKEFVGGYRKFWEQHNKSREEEEAEAAATTEVKAEESNNSPEINLPKDEDVDVINGDSVKKDEVKRDEKIKKNKASKGRKRKKFVESSPFGKWDVSVMDKNGEQFVDDVFDDLEYRLKNKTNEKLKRVLKKKLPKGDTTSGASRKSKAKKVDLGLPKQVKKIIINERLVENDRNDENTSRTDDLKILQSIIESEETKPNEATHKNTSATAKPVNLSTDLPDVLTLDENEEEEGGDQRGIIAEAFEDDDILDQFGKDKREEIRKDKPEDINTFLPGWGSWSGADIKPSRRKTKRFILKFPKEMPRKDKNKGNLIISEKADKRMRPHLVNELPFPFKSVKEFEASLRAPIGKTFVTETAFRRLTRPAVTTKLGAIIKPMSQDVLLKQSGRITKKRRQIKRE